MSGISRQAACEQIIVAVLDTVTNLNGSSSDKWTGSTEFGLCVFTKKRAAHQVTSWKECWSRQTSEIHTYKNTHLLSGYRLSHFHNWIFYKLLYHSSAQEHEHVKFVKAMVPFGSHNKKLTNGCSHSQMVLLLTCGLDMLPADVTDLLQASSMDLEHGSSNGGYSNISPNKYHLSSVISVNDQRSLDLNGRIFFMTLDDYQFFLFAGHWFSCPLDVHFPYVHHHCSWWNKQGKQQPV